MILHKYGVKAGCIDLLVNNTSKFKSHIKVDNSTFTLFLLCNTVTVIAVCLGVLLVFQNVLFIKCLMLTLTEIVGWEIRL